ncbi:DgyrCDS337 [Dimorphilus gyrociliatus]|uniref:DgyrCDS337 n=1 Tax=Dimorphilus gyrociliatus TaxID=2664684 RepID=A0A7I8V4G0_9ANNE|nr:DgyrCDS337 [Dimorphilus gyrociliatus]
MEKFLGKWVSVSAENIDGFMKEMNVNYFLRKIAAYTTTYFEILEKGNGYVLRWRVAILSGSQAFPMNEEFTHGLPDGRTVVSLVTIEDGVWIWKQFGKPHDATFRRCIKDDDTMIEKPMGLYAQKPTSDEDEELSVLTLFNQLMFSYCVSMILRKAGALATTYMDISMDGDTFSLKWKIAFKGGTTVYKMDTEFDDTSPDGRKIKSRVGYKDGIWTWLQIGKPHDCDIKRWIGEDGNMIETAEANGVKCTKIFVRDE